MDQVLDFNTAFDLVLRLAGQLHPRAEQDLPLLAAHGRILAGPVLADRDQPPFDRSTRDGFALRAGAAANRTVIGSLRAGETWAGGPLGAEDALEIMTGAAVPPGADAVLMVEHATLSPEQQLSFAADRLPEPGQNIVPRGAELRAGAIALAAGTRLRASEIAVAASVGAAVVRVFRRPRVAILATGDELVEVEETPAPGSIRNSNSYSLAALVAETGGEPVRLPIVRDRVEDLKAAVEQALACDLLLFSGGVSMGKYDLVEGVLADAGAEFLFTGVRMQPGKPVVFGSLPDSEDRTFFFGLPGNPVSTQVTFLAFVAPVLRALCGEAVLSPPFAQATLAERIPARPGLTRLLPAHLAGSPAGAQVRLVPWQGSGDLAANARANCYLLLPAGQADFAPGSVLTVLLR